MNNREICQFREIDARQKIANWWCRLRGHPYQKREIESIPEGFDGVDSKFRSPYCKWQCMHCGEVSTKPVAWILRKVAGEYGEGSVKFFPQLDK